MIINKLYVVNQDAKCGGCNWGVSYLYAYGKNYKDAKRNNSNGLCANCICDILIENRKTHFICYEPQK